MNEEHLIKPMESIKLIRGAKDYRWEIRTLDMDINRLAEIDEKLMEKFNTGGMEE